MKKSSVLQSSDIDSMYSSSLMSISNMSIEFRILMPVKYCLLNLKMRLACHHSV